MEYTRKSKITLQARPPAHLPPLDDRSKPVSASLRRDLTRFTTRPVQVQRQVVRPVLEAAVLERREVQRVAEQRQSLQQQVQETKAALPIHVPDHAVQRVAAVLPTPPSQPQTPGDWVTVMRSRAGQVEGQRLDSRQAAEFSNLQRQVAWRLAQGFRQDRQEPQVRHAEYAGHLVALQRHPLSAPVARVVMGMIPVGERVSLQRVVDTTLQREREQRTQDELILNFQGLQRQLAELDAEARQPVFQRIQARRGAGNPLPVTVQRHLEQGLNTDLSRVRIHDDAEADKLARNVHATAFTTGSDVFFQSGKYSPNTQSGLELLAHEVTHTRQQEQGQVGPGIDASPALEAEAQASGRKLAQIMPSSRELLPPNPHAPGVYTPAAALQRARADALDYAYYHPFLSLQRLGWDDVTSAAPTLTAPGKAAETRVMRQSLADTPDVVEITVIDKGVTVVTTPGGATHQLGEAAGPNILVRLFPRSNGSANARWFNFAQGCIQRGTLEDWEFIQGVTAGFDAAETARFAAIGRQLSPKQWQEMDKDPTKELFAKYEAGGVAIDEASVLTAYKGQVHAEAERTLDGNEAQLDELLGAADRLDKIKTYTQGLLEASLVRDALQYSSEQTKANWTPKRDELSHSLAQAQGFSFGIAGTLTNQDTFHRLQIHKQIGEIDQAIASKEEAVRFWKDAFPLLTRLSTADINPDRILQSLLTIKGNIAAARKDLGLAALDKGSLNLMDLQPVRAKVNTEIGAKERKVVADEDASRNRWKIAGAAILTVGGIALLFVPGGVFIDVVVGVALAAKSIDDAVTTGRAAGTGLNVDDGLMTQAQASDAKTQAILSTIFASIGALAAGFKVLRLARVRAAAELSAVIGETEYAALKTAAEAAQAAHPELAALSIEELVAIRAYTKESWSFINAALRLENAKEFTRLGRFIDLMKSGIGKLPIFKGTVRRTIALSVEDAAKKYKVGATVVEDAFTSTTFGKAVAQREGNVLLTIESSTGRNITSIAEHAESEILFLPGAKFKVTKVERHGDAFLVWKKELP